MYAAKAQRQGAGRGVRARACARRAVDRLELVGRRAGRRRGRRDASCTSSRSSTSRTLEVEGHEALVRWQHPQRGPARARTPFMPLRRGDRAPSSRWAGGCSSGRASRPQRWPSAGQIGVNLAARQLLDPAAVTTVAGDPHPHRHRPAAGRARDHRVGAPRRRARSGTDCTSCGRSACSSPSTTSAPATRRSATSRACPVDIVKIDRSFVERLGGPPGDEVLVRADGAAGARASGCASVGEGVETPAQLERLQAFGCDAAQGYLFGDPQEEPRFDLGDAPPAAGERRRAASAVSRVRLHPARQPCRAWSTGLGEVGAADEQVGQPGVGLVVAERAAVEAADVEPGGQRPPRRARRCPTRTDRRRGRRRRPRRARRPSPWRRPSPSARAVPPSASWISRAWNGGRVRDTRMRGSPSYGGRRRRRRVGAVG